MDNSLADVTNTADARKNRHLKFLTTRLELTLNDKSVCDVTFLVRGEKCHACSTVLRASSKYFDSLLSGAFKDGKLVIIDVNKPSFEACLRFLYTGSMAGLTVENVLEVLQAADLFEIEPLCAECGEIMLSTLDAANCVSFVAAIGGLSTSQESLAKALEASLQCVETSLQRLVDSIDDAFMEDIKQLSLACMLQVCARIGMGLAKVGDPASCLKRLLPAVLGWAEEVLDIDKPTFASLYDKADQLDFLELMKEGMVHGTESHVFQLTQAQLAKENARLESGAFAIDGYSFKLSVNANVNGTEHIGVYLTPLQSKYPEWWLCRVRYYFESADFDVDSESDTIFDADFFHIKSLGMGKSKYLKHTAIPAPPLGAAEIQPGDIRVELPIDVNIALNPLVSLCAAYAFFYHDETWSVMSSQHLAALLLLNSLPVESEDIVLERLLSLDTAAERSKHLEMVLPYVRWQFLSTESLLKCVRDRDVRNCNATKKALRWLHDKDKKRKPRTLKETQRSSYKTDVLESPVTQQGIFEALLEGIDDYLEEHCSPTKKAQGAEQCPSPGSLKQEGRNR